MINLLIAYSFLAVLMAYVVFGPVVNVKAGSGARNNGGFVEVPPASESLRSGQSPLGRLRQEKAEFKLAWLVGILPASLVPAVVFATNDTVWTDMPSALFVALGTLAIAAVIMSLGRAATNHWDFVGTNIEIMTGIEEGNPDYRMQEITRMVSPGQDYQKWSNKRVSMQLDKYEWLAKLMRRFPGVG